MSGDPMEAGNRTVRGRLARIGASGRLLMVASCLLIIWAGLSIWRRWEAFQPLRAIRSGTTNQRRAAAEEIAQRPDIDTDWAMAALIDALADDGVVVRAAAAQSLGSRVEYESREQSADRARLKRRVEVANRALVPLLSDPDPAVRLAAAHGLGAMGRIPISGPQTSSQPAASPEVSSDARRRAAAMAYLLPEVPLPPQLIAALQDNSSGVRAAAAMAIARFGPDLDPAIPALFAAIERGDREVRTACDKALFAAWPDAALVPFLIRSLASRDLQVRRHAAELLGRIGPEAREAIPALIAVLNEPFDLEAWDQLKATGYNGMEPTWAAAVALGRMAPDRDAIAALVAAISPENFARYTWTQIEVHVFQPPTSEAIGRTHKEGSRILGALHSLEDIGPPALAAVPALISIYRDAIDSRNSMAHGRIPIALGRIAPNSPAAPEAVAALIRAFDEQDTHLWKAAIDALGQFGPDAADAIPRLRALRRDPRSGVGDAARKALATIEAASAPQAREDPVAGPPAS